MKFDQKLLKYAPVTNQTLAKKSSKHVGISDLMYRKSLTATFGITFSNIFLPVQLVYRETTAQSILGTKFLESIF